MTNKGLATVFVTSICIFQFGSALGQKPLSDLENFQARYRTHLELVNRPLIELSKKYEKALNELKVEVQGKGNLDGLVAVEKERKRFEKERAPSVNSSEFTTLARIQSIYAEQYEDTRERLKKDITVSHAAFRQQLEELMIRLTRTGDIDEAIKVRNALENLGDAPGEKNLETGLVLHLKFESEKGELVHDASGSGNHARLIGDANNHSTGQTRGSYAVLDGKGDYLECAHADSLILQTHGSISVWVRPKRLQSMRGLVSKYNPTKAYTLRTWEEGSNGKVAFGDTKDNFISKSELRENRWTHIVMTLDDGLVKFYFDGKFDGEGRRAAPLTKNTDPLRIGNDYDGRFFYGDFDDIRIYNRPLSAKEVTGIYRIES